VKPARQSTKINLYINLKTRRGAYHTAAGSRCLAARHIILRFASTRLKFAAGLGKLRQWVGHAR
jgi:hypothetical protein